MPEVELIYDGDCPNVPAARANLLRAFRQAGITPRWREWDRANPQSPAYVRGYGSPTILVDGRDVAGTEPTDAPCCRIYIQGKGRTQGVPGIEIIVAALAKDRPKHRTSTAMLAAMTSLPAVGTALAPTLTCPACWPAYTGLLSALGIGFINYSPYLLPLTTVFLAVVLATLAWRAQARRGYAPLALGTLAAAVMLIGKFHFDSDAATYAGIALLISASLWNAWPRQRRAASCPACADNACTDNLKGGVT